MKMEAFQPSGSFKLRGIGHACRIHQANGIRRFISSSGGNAGLAVAYAGRKLKIPVTVVVPESTSARAIELIEQEDAGVIIRGETWQEAHEYAQSLAVADTALIHPFDDPLLWEGHATVMDEIVQQGVIPDMVILSVGGGGLLCGVMLGLVRNGIPEIPVLAVETRGADSLAASCRAGEHVEIDGIRSIATSLGAKKVARAAFEWTRSHNVMSHVVSDREALDACRRFSRDHRILVEPACGASLAPVYGSADFLESKGNIVVILCGGAGVTLEKLDEWEEMLV